MWVRFLPRAPICVRYDGCMTLRMKEYVVGGTTALLVLAATIYVALHGAQPAYTLAEVQQGPLVQEVFASGSVAAPTTVDLQFQTAGTLASVGVAVGDRVAAGQVLARQDDAVLQAALAQAKATAAAQEAQLESLKLGTRPEQIAVTQAQVASDQTALAQANQSVLNALRNAYTQADDAVHNKVDVFFNNPRGPNPQIAFSCSNAQQEATLESDRLAIEAPLNAWRQRLANLDAADAASAAPDAQADLALAATLLADANAALNAAQATPAVPASTLSGWVAGVAAARTSIDTTAAALTNTLTAQRAAAAALDKDQKTLALEQAGSTSQAIAAAAAQVAAAEAQVASVEAQLALGQLRAPTAGVVTAVNGSAGEAVSPSEVVVSLLPDATLQVDVNLSEDNVAGVAVGQPVSIALDAFPGTAWQGAVSKVDPAQTLIGGAVYYKTTVLFNTPDARVKPGMTANVLIQTGAATSTLIVPASALEHQGTTTQVMVYRDGAAHPQAVTVGLVSRDGRVEIRSGLTAGQEVVVGSR